MAGMQTQAQFSVSADASALDLETALARIAELTEAVAARDTFIAVAAHELRNPMTPILGQIELMLLAVRAGRCSPSEAEQRLVRIQQTVRRYTKRAVVLLDVSRINTQQFRLDSARCDLVPVLRDVAEEFADAAQHAGATILLTAPERAVGWFDRLAVEQVVDNLVSNAIKYGGGSPVEISLSLQRDRARIAIRDHGRGVPAEDRARIFGRFERIVGTTEYRSGFGVGLWVVGQLVAAMMGDIAIEDAPGGGALFIVTLPLDPGKAGDGTGEGGA